MFKKIKEKYVSIKELNKILAFCKQCRRIAYTKKEMFNENFGYKWALVEDLEIKCRVTVKTSEKNLFTYIARKDAQDDEYVRPEDQAGGQGYQAFSVLSLYYKIPRTNESTYVNLNGKRVSKYGSAKPFLNYNKNFENKRVKAIAYDINSAYSYAMINAEYPVEADPIRQNSFIKDNEIGFIYTETTGLTCIKSGFATYIFHKQQCPDSFKRFVEKWYKKKQTSDIIKKCKAKNTLNHCIGYIQRINPFYRSAIITEANNFVKNIINENLDKFIYSNTDSIIFTEPIPSINIGENIGQFKIEHDGLFAFKGFNFQWDYNIPSYRSKSKNWFKDGWDILNDDLPTRGNYYVLKDLQLKENICEK